MLLLTQLRDRLALRQLEATHFAREHQQLCDVLESLGRLYPEGSPVPSQVQQQQQQQQQQQPRLWVPLGPFGQRPAHVAATPVTLLMDLGCGFFAEGSVEQATRQLQRRQLAAKSNVVLAQHAVDTLQEELRAAQELQEESIVDIVEWIEGEIGPTPDLTTAVPTCTSDAVSASGVGVIPAASVSEKAPSTKKISRFMQERYAGQ